MYLPLCSNTYDDVTDFKICRFHKNLKNLDILKTKHIHLIQFKKIITNQGLLLWQKLVL